MTVLKFLPEPEPCRICQILSPTVKFGGRVPMHIGCDKRAVEPLDENDLADVIANLADVLGPLEYDPERPPTRSKDIGPCVKCQKPTRRYGPFGRAACHSCDEGSDPLVDPNQLALFQPAECACGHTMLAVEADEPCPYCLTDPEAPHDCPLQVEEQ